MRVVNATKQIMNLGDHVVLLPGLNANVNEEAFRKATEIALVRWHIEQGNITPAEGDEDPVRMPETAAVKLIGQTIQVDFLAEWAAREKRPSVAAALDKRLAALRPPAPKAKDEDETPAPKRR